MTDKRFLIITIIFLTIMGFILGFMVYDTSRQIQLLHKTNSGLLGQVQYLKKVIITCDNALSQTNDLLENRTVMIKLHNEKPVK